MNPRKLSLFVTLAILLTFSLCLVSCEEESETGGTIVVRNNSDSDDYEFRILNSNGESIAGVTTVIYGASTSKTVNKDGAYRVEYRIFWTNNAWSSKNTAVSNGGSVTVNIP